MRFLDETIKGELKARGYQVIEDDKSIHISSKISSSYFMAGASVFAGLIIMLLGGNELGLLLLGFMLVAVPIYTFRRFSKKYVKINLDDRTVASKSGLISGFQKKEFGEIDDLVGESYEMSSYTSAFEEGNKDYFLDIILKFKDSSKVELFHFRERNPEKLQVDSGRIFDRLRPIFNGSPAVH